MVRGLKVLIKYLPYVYHVLFIAVSLGLGFGHWWNFYDFKHYLNMYLLTTHTYIYAKCTQRDNSWV